MEHSGLDSGGVITPLGYARHLIGYISDPSTVRVRVLEQFDEAPSIDKIMAMRRLAAPPPGDDERAIIDAKRHELRARLAELPHPRQFAQARPLKIKDVLCGAWRSQDPANSGCWRVGDGATPLLAPYGLVDVRTGYLSVFGNQVRKALRADEI